MSVTYSGVANHPALSIAAAAEAQSDRFFAQQQLAEMLLGLDGEPFTATDDVTRAEHAIALQVSFQFAQGIDAHVYSGLSSDRMESRSFRGDRSGAALFHAGAKLLADRLLASRGEGDDGEWCPGVRSVRGPSQ